MMRSQTRINPYYLMIFEQTNWTIRFLKNLRITWGFFIILML
jgi:hypothetical protein